MQSIQWITVHPRYLYASVLSVWTAAWFLAVTSQDKCMAFVSAVAYGLMEATWYRFWEGQWFTTWEQFVANVLVLPLTVCAYRRVVFLSWLRIVLFPFNLWVFEIVCGYMLQGLFGTNRAWSYKGCPYAAFDDHVSFRCFWRWLLFGVLVEMAYSYVEACTCAQLGFPPSLLSMNQ